MALPAFHATLSRAEILAQVIGGWWVDGGPGQPGPAITRDLAQIFAAILLREMASQIGDPRAAATVQQLGLDLAERGTAELIANYRSEGPPIWIDAPFPFPWPPKKFDPNKGLDVVLEPGMVDDVLPALARRLAQLATGLPAPAAPRVRARS